MKKILGILFSFLIIGVGCTTDSMRYYSTINPVVDNEYTIEESQIIKNKKIVGYDYLLISPDGTTTTLPKEFSKDFKFEFKNDAYFQESVESFNIPTNLSNPDEIIFSTSENINLEGTENINRIYSYNLKTKKRIVLFKEQNKSSQILRTIGREGSKIIIFEDTIDNSPGICTVIWKDYPESLYYIDLKVREIDLKKYIVPQNKINEAEKIQETCLKMEIEN